MNINIDIRTAILGGMLVLSSLAWATEPGKPGEPKKVKPYTLKTCIVSDEKLNGDMGKPYVFDFQGQEIKLCCKGCLKDFQKDPAKYLKKLADAQKGAKEKAPTAPTAPAHDPSAHQH